MMMVMGTAEEAAAAKERETSLKTLRARTRFMNGTECQECTKRKEEKVVLWDEDVTWIFVAMWSLYLVAMTFLGNVKINLEFKFFPL
jgi:hypothetical protein